MKEWTKPEMQELNICNTEDNLDTGTYVDADVYDHITGEYLRSLYSL